MSSGLRELLGLPEANGAQQTRQAEEFGQKFRGRMAGLNRDLQLVSALASQAEHQTLDTQRSQLYKAFQKASAGIDPVDPDKAALDIQRVIAAVTAVQKKASEVAAGVMAGRDEWLKREAEFDDALLRIGELEQVQHPKAAALRKLGEAIRSRANDRKYRASVTALEQLRPKLDSIYVQHQQQATAEAAERRKGFKQARKAWVAVREKAVQDLELVKDAIRDHYRVDPEQFPIVMERMKQLDEILDHLSDDLRAVLDAYVATPLRQTARLEELGGQAKSLVNEFLSYAGQSPLLAAIDQKEFADVTIKSPIELALKKLASTIV